MGCSPAFTFPQSTVSALCVCAFRSAALAPTGSGPGRPGASVCRAAATDSPKSVMSRRGTVWLVFTHMSICRLTAH